jgi:hypothetical protein
MGGVWWVVGVVGVDFVRGWKGDVTLWVTAMIHSGRVYRYLTTVRLGTQHY